FWVAAGIPVAMMATLAIMFAAGLTINMISLFALIITLGIVVDDAIVVGEHADFRARSLGESPAVAAESAARRMAAPVFSATVTTVIAFAGLTAIGGRFGDLIMAIPFTVIAVLAASLIECFLILPHHMKNALVHSANDHWYDWPSRQVNRGFEWVRERGFRPFVKWMIWARYPVLAAAILALAVQISSFLAGDVTWRFFNPPEQSRVTANVIMADEASRADTIAMLQELQRAANQVGAELAEEHGADPVLFALSQLGATDGAPSASTDNKDSDQLGSITIDLIDPDLRPYSSFLFVDSMRDAVRESALTEQVSFRSWRRGPQGEAIDVELFGGDTDILKAAAEALTAALSQYPEVSSPGDNLAYDRDELSLSLTPQGEALGFDIDSLGMVLGNRLGGIEAASFPDGPRTATIRVELPATELTADFLDTTLLRAESGAYVPLADIVEVETRSGFSRILRENGIITVSVSADMSEDDPERAAAILAELENRVLPQIASEFGIGFQMAGLAEQERDFLSDAMLGLALCLAGIYIVLAWIFASWTRPLVVMAIIPFGLIGTIYGHAAWDVPMSMFTVVGLIGMTGIIINDSIVLVTTIDEKAQKISWNEAIVDGVADRLRPVLLTTLTTVLGLTPLLYEGSSQAEFLKPTVITLVYGLGVGMVIVLLVVPAIMAMQSDFADRMRALRRAVTPRHGRMGLPLAVFATGAVIAAWFAATMGAFITSGTAAFALPIGDSGLTQAFVSFILGAALISAMSVSIAAFRSSTS
ncbi:MAG: efflux RND transporter permease subunit, partial [Pseudomonadota bacterium]